MGSIKDLVTSRRFHVLIGWSISIALLIWVFSSVNWHEILLELEGASIWHLIPLTILLLLGFIFRAMRWRYILPGGASDVPLKDLHAALMIGTVASNILPLRAGEFIRPYVLSRDSRYSFFQAFLSVVLERFFDLVTVLLGFAFMIPWVPGIPDQAFKIAVFLSVLALGIFLAIILAAFSPDFCERMLELCLRRFPAPLRAKFAPLTKNLIESAKVVRPIKQICATLVLTVAVWGSCLLYHIVGLQMFGFSDLFWPGLALTVILALGVAFPSAPGFIGVYEASVVGALMLFGASKEQSIAIAVVLHTHQFIYVSVGGAILLIKRNLSFNTLKNLTPKSA